MRPLTVFIVQPFGAPHTSDFRTLVEEVCDDSDGDFEAVSAATTSSNGGPRLQDRIDTYIKSSDICVADLTGTRNENALLEVGAAYTLGLPVIPVSDKELPSDIRGNLYLRLDAKRLSDEHDRAEFVRGLKQRLAEAADDVGREQSKRGHFVAKGFESRRNIDFYSLVRRSESRIDILTTNLGYIVQEKLSRGRGRKKQTFLQMLAEALRDKPIGFRVRVLALHPDSNFTNDRALGLGRDRSEFRNEMRADLDMFRSFVESSDCIRSVQIKTYDAFPLQMTYYFDDIVLSSVVATARSSRACISYVHSLKTHGAKETYESHFDSLWGSGEIYAISRAHISNRPTWKVDGNGSHPDEEAETVMDPAPRRKKPASKKRAAGKGAR